MTISYKVSSPEFKILPQNSSFLPSMTSMDLQGSFVISTVNGYEGGKDLIINFEIVGSTGAPIVNKYSNVSIKVNIISTLDPPDPPVLTDARFSNSGTSIVVNFGGATNMAADILGNQLTWKCSIVLDFPDAENTKCMWISKSSIQILLPAKIKPNDSIFLIEKTVKPDCSDYLKRDSTGTCTAYSSGWLPVSSPVNPQAPVAILSSPSLLSSCDDLFLDASASSGSAGRKWKEVSYSVVNRHGKEGLTNSLGSNVFQTANAQYDVSFLVHVDGTLLEAGMDYTFTLTLTNFLGITTTASTVVTRSNSANIPNVVILGDPMVKVTAGSVVSLSALGTVSSCAESQTLTYSWEVFCETKKKGNLTSTDPDPRKFRLKAYSLEVGKQYIVRVTATASTKDFARDEITISVIPDDLKAVLNVPGYIQLGLGDSLVLDGSGSRDLDYAVNKPSSLSYSWSCSILSGLRFGKSCNNFFGLISKAHANVTVSGNNLRIGEQYEQYGISLGVTARVNDGRADQTTITLVPAPEGYLVSFPCLL